jgi:hypothetical protein
MSVDTKTNGGFSGGLAEAFAPPASSGCCGTAATRAEGDQPVAATCCGTAEAAQAAAACCTPDAKAEAVASGAGCCG